jgi:hypothetical protein
MCFRKICTTPCEPSCLRHLQAHFCCSYIYVYVFQIICSVKTSSPDFPMCATCSTRIRFLVLISLGHAVA